MKENKALVKIMGKEVNRIEYRNEPVVTFRMMDELHERTEGTARGAFFRHKDKLIEGEDFFEVPFEDWSQIIAVENLNGDTDETSENNLRQRNPMKFLTQTGYLMLVKSFTDDLAWKVQRELVKCYFAVKRYKQKFRSELDERLAKSEETRRSCRVIDSTIKAMRTGKTIAETVFRGEAELEEFPMSEEVRKYVDRYLEDMKEKEKERQKYTGATKNGHVHPVLLQFWHEFLSADSIPGEDRREGKWMGTGRLYDMLLSFAKSRNMKIRNYNINIFGKQLKRICPFIKQRPGTTVRKWGYAFPSLEICRQSFTEVTGHPVAFDRKSAGEIRSNA